MRTLMSSDAWVHYGQIHVQSGPDLPGSSHLTGSCSQVVTHGERREVTVCSHWGWVDWEAV